MSASLPFTPFVDGPPTATTGITAAKLNQAFLSVPAGPVGAPGPVGPQGPQGDIAPFFSVEIAADTSLTSALHNGRQLIISAPVTLTAVYSDLGDGFNCKLLNYSGGNVVMGGMVNVNGATRLANGASGFVGAAAWSGGQRVQWGGDSTL